MTVWEAHRILENPDDFAPKKIIVAMYKLGNVSDVENIDLIMPHLDCDIEGICCFTYRSYMDKRGIDFATMANNTLRRITGLDFGYDQEVSCEEEVNQKAIQAWNDWYDNEYDSWLVNFETQN